MAKTMEQLQTALDRELEYSASLNKKIDRLRDQLKNSISKAEHEKILVRMQQKYELEMSEIKIRQSQGRNERGAGRKKKATDEVIARVLVLKADGLSQKKIAQTVSDELGITISRTTVGEIVRGKYVDEPLVTGNASTAKGGERT